MELYFERYLLVSRMEKEKSFWEWEENVKIIMGKGNILCNEMEMENIS